MERIILGYDPGGARANGAAVLRVVDSGAPAGEVETFDYLDQVLDWFRERVEPTRVHAAGIDTFLSWATGRSGWRPMDRRLRKENPKVARSIVSSNSASGSMAVQGMAMAIKLKQDWPRIHLNETHPKVLFHALAGRPYGERDWREAWLARMIGAKDLPAIRNDHEWDALASAWATWQGLSGNWEDLMRGVHGLILPVDPVTYFWP